MAPTILVVDDDPDFVEITRTILLDEGYEVITAASGDEALRKVRSDKPDLILLDIMMDTILDGVNVSQELRDDPQLRQIPLVMISSITSTEHAEMFPTDEYLHVDGWLSKPIQPQDLLKVVSRFV
ncbi:MAG: response regulator [Anaerolineae bacterium]|nr:response regulator [Anaerolineae bacterium]